MLWNEEIIYKCLPDRLDHSVPLCDEPLDLRFGLGELDFVGANTNFIEAHFDGISVLQPQLRRPARTDTRWTFTSQYGSQLRAHGYG